VIKKGYAVIIQNTAYNKQEFSTIIGSVEVSQFFEQCGFKTELCTDFTAQVMCTFYLPAIATNCQNT